MTQAILITSGKIKYQLPGLSLYNSLCKTANGELFPCLEDGEKKNIISELSNLKGAKVVLSAPSCQAHETAEIIAEELELPLEIDPSLLPLRFDLNKIISEEKFEILGKQAFDVMRNSFLENFYKDNLNESRYEVRDRFNKLKKYLCTKYPEETVIIVSHAFLIKLFEAYSKVGDRMFANKKLLFELFNPSQQPLGRLGKLVINL